MPNKVKKRHLLDYSIFIPYLILSIVGLIMVYSSTSALQVMKGFSPTSFVINQVAFWVVGLVAMFFIYKMKTSVFQNRSFIMFAIAVITVMVLAVRIPGIGKEIN
ncbi:FtsW/RodA/SpoVE family cell cycle protein, partial [Enterococcus faecalis]